MKALLYLLDRLRIIRNVIIIGSIVVLLFFVINHRIGGKHDLLEVKADKTKCELDSIRKIEIIVHQYDSVLNYYSTIEKYMDSTSLNIKFNDSQKSIKQLSKFNFKINDLSYLKELNDSLVKLNYRFNYQKNRLRALKLLIDSISPKYNYDFRNNLEYRIDSIVKEYSMSLDNQLKLSKTSLNIIYSQKIILRVLEALLIIVLLLVVSEKWIRKNYN